MKNKAIVIFSGFNQRAVIAFLRVLTQKNVLFGIIAKSNADTILLTEYKDKVLFIRQSEALELEDALNSLNIVKQKLNVKELIIAPSTEALNRFILKFRNKFKAINCQMPLVEESHYNQISDKFSFSLLCKSHGIKIPEEMANIDEAAFPYVAKPKTYFSKKTNKTLAPVLIFSKEQALEFKTDYHPADFYFQKYIESESKYLLYYFHRDGSIYKFSQENLIQQPEGKSMVAAVSSNFHLSSESDKYEKLFKEIGFFGFVMVEIKGDNYMIEANPRFWGPSQLFVDAKVNLFEAFLHDYGLINEKPVIHQDSNRDTFYFWYGGIVQILLKNGRIKYHNYSAEKLIKNFPAFIEYDVYRREDTYQIFKTEVKL